MVEAMEIADTHVPLSNVTMASFLTILQEGKWIRWLSFPTRIVLSAKLTCGRLASLGATTITNEKAVKAKSTKGKVLLVQLWQWPWQLDETYRAYHGYF